MKLAGDKPGGRVVQYFDQAVSGGLSGDHPSGSQFIGSYCKLSDGGDAHGYFVP